MHRHFFKILYQNKDYVKTFAMIEKTVFNLHVVNGFFGIIHKVDLI